MAQNFGDQNSNIINLYFQNQNTSNYNTFSAYEDLTLNDLKAAESTEVFQMGNYNLSNIKTHSEHNTQVVQKGDYNLYEVSTYYNSNPTDISVLQNGNNNNLMIFGQNSLSNSMQIIQNANHQTLIINNY
jgi:hypothetical protein